MDTILSCVFAPQIFTAFRIFIPVCFVQWGLLVEKPKVKCGPSVVPSWTALTYVITPKAM
jgi:hypothetical protein